MASESIEPLRQPGPTGPPLQPLNLFVQSRSRGNSTLSPLLDSPSRVVIPLSPASEGEAALPNPQSPEDCYDEHTTSDSSGPAMILDYLSRLARFEPRIRRYAARKLSEHEEPVRAFWAGGSASATSSVRSPPSRGTAEKGEAGSDGKSDANVAGHVIDVPPQQSETRGFSLVDMERLLLSAAPGRGWWWKGSSASSPVASTHTDADSLDVDLSQLHLFERGASTPSSEPTNSTGEPKDGPSQPEDQGPGLFLDYLSSDSLRDLLESTGVLGALEKRGYRRPSLIFDTSDAFQHRISLIDPVLFEPSLNLASSERFLIDLYMKRRRSWNRDGMVCYQLMKRLIKAGGWEKLRELTGEVRAPYVGLEGAREVVQYFDEAVPFWSKGARNGNGEWDVTEIAWMQMHDPQSQDKRSLLPGQRFPGLGVGRDIAKVTETFARESRVTDALLNFPFHWHNAAGYALGGYQHLDPIYEAYFQWMTSQLASTIAEHGYCFTSWALSLGHLRRITSEIVDPTNDPPVWRDISNRLERWSPSEQLYPTGSSIEGFLASKAHRALRDKYRAIFERDGGANLEGVQVVKSYAAVESQQTGGSTDSPTLERRARLAIDLEGCPELWKYSLIWKNRDPETGAFS